MYPKTAFPLGHPKLALSLNNLATAEHATNRLADARKHYEAALAINKTYFKTNDSHGHIRIAVTYRNLGELDLLQKNYQSARKNLRNSLSAYKQVARRIIVSGSEAESLNFAAQIPDVQSALVSTVVQLAGKADRLYTATWQSRGAILELLSQRHQHWTHAQNADVRNAVLELRQVREQLSRHTFAPLTKTSRQMLEARSARLRELSRAKESLERKLARLSPAWRRRQASNNGLPTDLIAAMPPATALIDFVLYTRIRTITIDGRPQLRTTPAYLAFVLASGKQVQMVDLGSAAPIDLAIRKWRWAMRTKSKRKKGLPDLFIAVPQSALALRRLVWQPIVNKLPSGCRKLYIVPEGSLTGIPWSALPGAKSGTCLVHRYSIAVVPSGQFLLAAYRGRQKADAKSRFLVAGNVDYNNRKDRLAQLPAGSTQKTRPTNRRTKSLPGTKSELAMLRSVSGKRPLIDLEGAAATTTRVRRELPRARWAVLATHGFFQKSAVRSLLQPNSDVFSSKNLLRRGERVTTRARNPLLLSGLVLAGSNLPRLLDAHGNPQEDGGILSGEEIASLPLHGLELAVLSACETGLGDVAGNEGVFGLQRAFHMAGARTVVGSLWSVPDRATSLLMQEFYTDCFKNGSPPLSAMRKAQLKFLADVRSIAKPSQKKLIVNPYHWAAFTVSGIGH